MAWGSSSYMGMSSCSTTNTPRCASSRPTIVQKLCGLISQRVRRRVCRFRFLDSELVFLRHEPRHRVQMANVPFRGASGAGAAPRPSKWALTMKANREANAYSFLEPVAMEFELTSKSVRALPVDAQVIAQRIAVWVQRSGGAPRRWRPMVTALYDAGQTTCLKRGESLHGAHLISAAAEGWLIDEPGTYSVRAAIDVAGEIVFSNVGALNKLATALTDAGNTVAAKRVKQCIVATTKRRNIRGQRSVKR